MMQYEIQSESDSEAELQAAFAQGLLKPGLNAEEIPKKTFVNNEVALNRKLNEIVLKLPWLERLDLTTKPAEMAPELAAKISEEREKLSKTGKTDDPVLNDFIRETTFLRQAQTAVLTGIARLKEMGIITKRPEDYFAEMAKSDSHMQKIRATLVKKKNAMERAEKVRHIRQMRKINKELQKQARVNKENEKREFLDQVKKYRQKMITDLDFLDAKPKIKPKPGTKQKKLVNRKVEAKRKYKESKYGLGGKKRGSKRNTKESFHTLPGTSKGKGKEPKAQRMGKNRRAQNKQKGGKKR